MRTRLVFIRHGITEWNKERRYCGNIDVGLSNQGKAQAKKLRDRLKSVKFDKIYCSSRRRAIQTAKIVFAGEQIIKLSALREINFGVIEGLRRDQIMKKYAVVYKKWLDDPYKVRLPGAEDMQVFRKRVGGAIKKILYSNRGKTIAVVCHGGAIGIFVSNILKSRNFWRYVPAAASVTVVDFENGKLKLKSFNQTWGRFSTQS